MAETSTSATPATTPAAPTTAATEAVPRPTADCRQLVQVGDGRLHVRCVGAGETTVVLIAGFNDGGDNWGRIDPRPVRAVPGLLLRPLRHRRERPADDTANLRHLRPRPPHPPERDRRARPVRRRRPLLRRRPSRDLRRAPTRDEVDGLLLLDATPTTWTAASCAVPDDGSEAAADFVARCPDPALPTDNPEQLDEVAGFAEVAAIDTLGSLPLSVVTAAEHPFPGLDPVEATRLDDVWNQGQQHWMSLSSAAQLVTVDDTGHYIQLDRPDAVIAEIQKLLPGPADRVGAGTASVGALR